MLICIECSRTHGIQQPIWRCSCGGRLLMDGAVPFDAGTLSGSGVWRFREHFRIAADCTPITLGEGATPMLDIVFGGRQLYAKLDFLCPTGSYKDRGSAVMMTQLRDWGLTEIVEDSSGNAGASIAAYANVAGIRANIYVPESASPGKIAQIRLHGGNVVQVPGSREACAAAALEAAETTFYASHNWSPYFLLGLKSSAYELAEQLAWNAPDWIVVPAGNGGLAGGLYYGFLDLVESGVVSKMPRIAMAQAAACAPVYQAWKQRLNFIPGIAKGNTVAEGIASARPVRAMEMLEALRGSNGLVETATEDEIWSAFEALAAQGIYVEPTSATAAAALRRLVASGTMKPSESAVLYLTGSGLKATDLISNHFASRFEPVAAAV